MKRRLIYIIFILAALYVQSCRVDDVNSETYNELSSFTNNLVNDSVNLPVLSLTELDSEESGSILKEGFQRTVDGVFLRLISASDSIWCATNALESDNLHFSSTIRMLPDNELGLHCWTCSSTAEYNESGSYRASLSTDTPANIYWKDSSTASSFSYDMVMDGRFVVDTSLSDGKALDCCTISYSAFPLDGSHSGYSVTIVSKR